MERSGTRGLAAMSETSPGGAPERTRVQTPLQGLTIDGRSSPDFAALHPGLRSDAPPGLEGHWSEVWRLPLHQIAIWSGGRMALPYFLRTSFMPQHISLTAAPFSQPSPATS